MIVDLHRISHGKDSTLGIITCGDLVCFTCEDEYREEKVEGETRIPSGTYDIALRNAGGMNEKYLVRYGFHRGMLHLQNVPKFEWVYIHTGNSEDDTRGCILVGYGAERDAAQGGGYISRSREAYKCIYKEILKAFDAGEEVKIVIRDHL